MIQVVWRTLFSILLRGVAPPLWAKMSRISFFHNKLPLTPLKSKLKMPKKSHFRHLSLYFSKWRLFVKFRFFYHSSKSFTLTSTKLVATDSSHRDSRFGGICKFVSWIFWFLEATNLFSMTKNVSPPTIFIRLTSNFHRILPTILSKKFHMLFWISLIVFEIFAFKLKNLPKIAIFGHF